MALEGKQLGKYHILEPLGRGGMSRVYRAYHPQLDRYVAVKVLRGELTEDERFMARFRREAQSVAQLRHPNIVQVFDFDIEPAEELTYMVMELLDGDSLKTRLIDYRVRGEQMPYGEMASILLNVLDGLGYAHEEGMVHRDIKPANILLTNRGQAVLADFGIAQIVGGTRHTMTGALMGTLAYMAPEQGLKGTTDARSDLYSLGIVFYEMLTQAPPYDADTPLAILLKHLNDPLPLPKRDETAVPLPFEKLILKALAKEPSKRFQTAREMAEALHEAIAKLQIMLPDRISPPLSFTTQDAPDEAVAVLSGEDREQLGNDTFSSDATDPALGEKLIDETARIAALKAEVMPQPMNVEPPKATPTLAENVTSQTAVSSPSLSPRTFISQFKKEAGTILFHNQPSLPQPLFTGSVMIIGNLTAVLLGIIFGFEVYAYGWAFIILLLSFSFANFLPPNGPIINMIPAFLFFVLGITLGIPATIDAWEAWAILWIVPALTLLFCITRIAQFRRDPEKKERFFAVWSVRLRRLTIVFAIFIVILAFAINS